LGVYDKYYADKRYNDDAPWVYQESHDDPFFAGDVVKGWNDYSLNIVNNEYIVSGYITKELPANIVLYDLDFNNKTYLNRLHINGLNYQLHRKMASDNTVTYIKGSYITSIKGNRYDYPSDGRHTDGYWYVFSNVPPTTPSSITLPLSIYGNTNFIISWNKSMDSDDDSITYRLERKVNSGSFQLVYNGSTNNYTDTAQSSWNTVQYRVRAYDGSDYSGIRTSDVSNVIHNQPPTVPPNINVPNEITENTSITVTWGKSTDPDGDTITYYLQRKTGWSYVNIYNGSSRTYTENVSSSWNTIQYRVRAYDGTDYSNYITSNVVTVVENLPPTVPSFITVPDTIKVEETFNISWGESIDPENDTVTYYLERSINGSSYVSIYSGINKNYSDTSQAGWDTISYKVRAYDGTSYSNYKTSSIITIKLFPELTMKIDNQLKTSEAGWVKIDNQLRDIEKIWIKVDGQLHEV
jgi:hypothetical protein